MSMLSSSRYLGAFSITFLIALPVYADTDCWDERGDCIALSEGEGHCVCRNGEEVGANWSGEDEAAGCESLLDLCGDPRPGLKATCDEPLRGRCLIRYHEGTRSAHCSCADGSGGDDAASDDSNPTQEELNAACVVVLESSCELVDPGPEKLECEADWGSCWIRQNGEGGCDCDDVSWSDGHNPDNDTVLTEDQMALACADYLEECRGDGDDDDDDDDHGDDDDDSDDNGDDDADPEDGDTGSTGDTGDPNDTGDTGSTSDPQDNDKDGNADDDNGGTKGRGCQVSGSSPGLVAGVLVFAAGFGAIRRRR